MHNPRDGTGQVCSLGCHGCAGMARDSEVPQLSTSRIHRLLRPLRTRCTSLAALGKGAQRRPATYSSKATVSKENVPPLLLLHSSSSVDKHSTDASELSRKVYAVRDCFRDILLATGQRDKLESGGGPVRIVRLAEMCSMVIGDTIEDEGATTNEEKETMAEFADGIYDVIPLEYRGCVYGNFSFESYRD